MPLNDQEFSEYRTLKSQKSLTNAQMMRLKDLNSRSMADAPISGEGKVTGIREKYLSEKMFGPITEGLAQAGAGLAQARAVGGMGVVPALAASAGAGVIGGGIEAARQITQRIAGEPIAPQTSSEAASRILKQAGMAAGMEGLTQVPFKIAGKILSKKELTPFQQSLRQSFEEKGIPYTPSDIINDKSIALLEATASRSLGGASVMQKAKKQQIGAFKKVVDNMVAKSGGRISTMEAGEIIQKGIKEASQIEKAKTDALYDYAYSLVDKNAPRKSLQSKVMAEKILSEPKYGRIDKGEVFSEKARQILSDVARPEKILNEADVKNFGLKPIKEPLRIGDLLADERKLNSYIQEQVQGPMGLAYNTTPEGRLLLQLQSSVRRDIDDFYKYSNPKAKAALEIAKQEFSKGKQTYSSKAIRDLAGGNPEIIVDKVVGYKNTALLKKVKEVLPPKDFDVIRQKTMQNFAEGVFGTIPEQNATEMFFRHRAVKNMVSDLNPETMEIVFGKDGVKQLEEIVRISNAMETAEKVAGNVSGTAQIQQMFNMVMQPLIGIPTAGLPYLYAKMITTKTGRDIILDGYKVKPGTAEAIKFANRFANFAALSAMQSRPKVEKK